MELFKWSDALDAQMHTRVKLLGGDADVDHTQTIGGYSQIIRGKYPPIQWRI